MKKTESETVKVRVLTDCGLGRANDVVELSAADAALAEAQGIADASKEAVSYAAGLEQNKS